LCSTSHRRYRGVVDGTVRFVDVAFHSQADEISPGTLRSIDYGPGYRVYFVKRDTALVILLAGGDKRTQERDIAVARELASNL
jgi:putative addiction module killer protein